MERSSQQRRTESVRPFPQTAAQAGLPWPDTAEERDNDRALFLHPQRLAEARGLAPAWLRRSGVLLAALTGLAVLVGDVRADEPASGGEAATTQQEAGFDYWEWLASLFGGGPVTEQKDGDNNDPGGGEE